MNGKTPVPVGGLDTCCICHDIKNLLHALMDIALHILSVLPRCFYTLSNETLYQCCTLAAHERQTMTSVGMVQSHFALTRQRRSSLVDIGNNSFNELHQASLHTLRGILHAFADVAADVVANSLQDITSLFC